MASINRSLMRNVLLKFSIFSDQLNDISTQILILAIKLFDNIIHSIKAFDSGLLSIVSEPKISIAVF
jgi:hypothetical protein